MKNQDGTWKEDIDCIVDPVAGKGGIFISNLEAASNPLTLQRTLFTMQVIESEQSSRRPRGRISHKSCPSTSNTSTSPRSTMSPLISPNIFRPPTRS